MVGAGLCVPRELETEARVPRACEQIFESGEDIFERDPRAAILERRGIDLVPAAERLSVDTELFGERG